MTRARAFLPAALAAALAATIAAGCGMRAFSPGSVPFPAKAAVFLDDSGKPEAGLPDAPEPYRLVLLDFAWCPPCADAWKAVREASREIPPGNVRVYRILFDRERLLRAEGATETGPLRPAPPPDAGDFPATTVLALTQPFLKEYGPEQAPVLFLLGRDGKVLKRWTGYSPSLAAAIVSEFRSVTNAPRSPGK